ncbi:MAG: MCE family protein [Oligoflexia bacterium]|nr:MCE family protein [Oligoflexia bacterium]
MSKHLEYKVGVFVAIGLVILLTFIVLLGGDTSLFRSSNTYRIRADETNGLYVGGVVQVAGIPAGNIKDVSFDEKENHIVIKISVEKGLASRLTQGSKAGLRTQGALGDKFINITPGPRDADKLRSGDFIETEPGSDLMTTISQSGNKIEKLFVILEEVEKLMKGLNSKNTGPNLGDAVAGLRGTTQSLDQILASLKGKSPKDNDVKKAMTHLASILEKIDSGQGSLGGLINDPTVHEDLKSLLGGAKRNKLLKYLIRTTIQKSEEEELSSKPGK